MTHASGERGSEAQHPALQPRVSQTATLQKSHSHSRMWSEGYSITHIQSKKAFQLRQKPVVLNAVHSLTC